MPRFEPDTTLQVDGTKVFDHSKFGVTLQNASHRTVEIESVALTSVGNAAPSGLGDIKEYWRGVGSDTRQCRTQWVDTMPYIPNPQ